MIRTILSVAALSTMLLSNVAMAEDFHAVNRMHTTPVVMTDGELASVEGGFMPSIVTVVDLPNINTVVKLPNINTANVAGVQTNIAVLSDYVIMGNGLWVSIQQ